MVVSPDGKHLATASKDGVTRVFDLATAQLSGGFKARRDVLCLCVMLSYSDNIMSHSMMLFQFVMTWPCAELICVSRLALTMQQRGQ